MVEAPEQQYPPICSADRPVTTAIGAVPKDHYARRLSSVIAAAAGGSCAMPGSAHGAVSASAFRPWAGRAPPTARAVPLAEDNSSMQIRIEGIDLPGRSCGPSNDVPDGYRNIHVGIQRRGKRDELLGLTPGDAPTVTWAFECQLCGEADPNGIASDIKGPYIQGPQGGRFIYLNWVTIDDAGTARLFRRAKLWLDGVPPAVLGEAARTGLLVGRLGLTDPKGNPTCSVGRPPTIEWSAGTA